MSVGEIRVVSRIKRIAKLGFKKPQGDDRKRLILTVGPNSTKKRLNKSSKGFFQMSHCHRVEIFEIIRSSNYL